MKKIFFILCFFSFSHICKAEKLEVVALNPQQQVEYLSSFTKIKFRNDSIFIYGKTNEIVSQTALTNIRVLVFNENEEPIGTAIDNSSKKESQVLIFPNPTTYSLKVENYEPIHTIMVFSLTGDQFAVDWNRDGSDATVDVSSLAAGSYLLLINQTVVKFIKQ